MKLNTLRFSVLFPRIRVWAFQRRFPDAPWLTEAAILFLESWLRPTDRGAEWGSGRSTVWLAERVNSLLSVEHDEQWSRAVRDKLRERGLQSRVQHLCKSLDETYEGVAGTIPHNSLDFALVDGRRRLACTKMVLPKIKPGGILILDNAERYIANRIMGSHSTAISQREQDDPEWKPVVEELALWRAILTTNRIWDTRIWVKPG